MYADHMTVPVVRLGIGLIPGANAALERLVRRTGLSKTDVLNRAVQIYDLVEEGKERGAELALRHSDGSFERVRIL